MTVVTLADDADRRLIREALDDTVVVEAAAGTGKTTELVARMLNVLAQGRARIEQIVAVTFTEKAAGELKLRLRKELEALRHGTRDAVQSARLDDAIQRLEDAHVSTIHGFCADLLRERPVEAGIDPLFTVLTEPQANDLFDEAFAGWLDDQLADPPVGVRRALRRSVRGREGSAADDGPIDRLRRAARELAEWRDFTAPWRRDPFDRDAALAAVLGRLREYAARSASPSNRADPLFVGTAPIRDLVDDVAAAESFGAADPDAWEARAVDLAADRDLRRARKGSGAQYSRDVPRDAVWAAFHAALAELDLFQRAADADLAARLRDELWGVLERYEALKARAGALDFVDLLLRARDLLTRHARVRRAFQARFSYLFVDEFQDTDPLQAEILLLMAAADPDETDWRRVSPLPGKLFIVGDPKQAIYRFRRADVETYREVCDLLAARGARRAFLHTSFRASPAIQRVVNAAFAPLMDGDRATLQADYVALSPSPLREDPADHPSVVVLPVPDPYGQRQVAVYAIDRSLPDAAGAFVAWLLQESGWTVTDRATPGELPLRRPIRARDVCLLFRRFTAYGRDVTRPYLDALEARGVPHLLVGGKSFHDREEIDTVRAALAAVEWPDDELAVFATLRGALFAVGDEALLAYRHAHGRFHPFHVPADLASDLQPIGDALGLLRALHARRNRRPVADTITELLDKTRAHVGLVLRAGGEQALANVLHLAELARQYEANGGLAFRGFVDRLREDADGGQAAEAPVLEEGSDGVRLMTAHKAKGLEFPVVLLADMTAKLRPERADRLIDRARGACYLRLGRWTPIELASDEAREIARDEAEGVRVAYVAATRARDLLVVPGVGDVPWDGGWVSPLNAALYPPADVRRQPAAAPGCPAFGRDSVRRRVDDLPAEPGTIAPGWHRFAVGSTPARDAASGSARVEGLDAAGASACSVVWWDPHALRLDVEAPSGLRRESLIVKDVPDEIVQEGLREHERWQRARADAIARGSTPSIDVRTATAWAADPAAGPLVMAAPVEIGPALVQGGLFDAPAGADHSPLAPLRRTDDIAMVDLRRRRTGTTRAPSRGARYGELVHALLAAVELDASPADIAALGALHARPLGSTPEESEAAVHAVAAALEHDLLGRARAAATAGRCRRETPIACRLADGTLIEGVVDLAFYDNGGWTVIDYKTDRELAAAGDARYRRQVALYAAAIEAATGQPATAVIARV